MKKLKLYVKIRYRVKYKLSKYTSEFIVLPFNYDIRDLYFAMKESCNLPDNVKCWEILTIVPICEFE